jgi:hypothetical protein
MSWLVDNANALYVLLAIGAAGFVTFGWLNRRVRYLAYGLGPIALIGLVWLLTRVFISDSKQLELNVDAIARAVVAGRTDDLLTHVSNDFRYKRLTRADLKTLARSATEDYEVNAVRIRKFNVDDLSREKKLAKTSFRVSAWSAGNDQPYMFNVEADFVLEGDQWKLQTMRFYNPFVNQDQELDLPDLP